VDELSVRECFDIFVEISKFVYNIFENFCIVYAGFDFESVSDDSWIFH
jgi:hypothetical protein